MKKVIITLMMFFAAMNVAEAKQNNDGINISSIHSSIQNSSEPRSETISADITGNTLTLSQIAFSQNAINYEKSDLFIHVNIPSLAYHPNNAYDCNIIQSYGLGIEYKFKNRLALSFNFTRNIQDFDYNVLNKNITYNSFVYKPSLRYYLDSNSKVYVDLGAVVNSCNDKIMENNVINEEKFVQNAITTGIGYKVYFLKNKRLGMDFFISTKIFIWENGRDDNYFRGTFIYDPFYFNGSVFYRF